MIPNSVVELNVGGQIYTFNRQTLANSPSGLLQRLFGVHSSNFGDEGVKDSNGRIFLDWDSRAFQIVASVLRVNEAIVPSDVDNTLAVATLQYFFDFPPLVQNKVTTYLTKSLCGIFLHGVFNSIFEVFVLGNKNYMALPNASSNLHQTYLRCGIIHTPWMIDTNLKSQEMGIDLQLNVKRSVEDVSKVTMCSALTTFTIRSTGIIDQQSYGGLSERNIKPCMIPFYGEHAKLLVRQFKTILHNKHPLCSRDDFYAWITLQYHVTDINISTSDNPDIVVFSLFFDEEALLSFQSLCVFTGKLV